MDSDDDFMSGHSSGDEDFGLEVESDDGSLGDGESRMMNPIKHALTSRPRF